MADELSAEDVIFGGGGVTGAKWETVGQWVGGPIRVKPRTYHAKEYVPGQAGSGRPLFKQNGEPIMGVRVDVVTGQRDPAVEYDDGTRRMHLDKWRQLEALRRALTEAGVSKLETGGELWVQWTGEETDGNTGNPAKTWTAKYRAPSQGVEIPGAPPAQVAGRPTDMGYSHPAQPTAPVSPVQPYAYPVHPHTAMPGAAPGVPAYAPQGPQSPPPAPMGAPAPSGPPMPPTMPPAATPGPQPTPAPAGAPGPTNVITASVAAALRAQGVDTSAFTVVPG